MRIMRRVKTIEQKIGELEASREALLKELDEEIAAIRRRFESRTEGIESALNTLYDAQKILLEETDSPLIGVPSNGHFPPKGSMSVRSGLIRALQDAGHRLHLDELMEALEELGVQADRGTVRARLTKGMGKDFDRVAEATYWLIGEEEK